EHGFLTGGDTPEADTGYPERGRHDYREARVPRSKDIEKTDDLCGFHHAGGQETPPEDQATDERGERLHALNSKRMTRQRDDGDRSRHEDRSSHDRPNRQPRHPAHPVARRTAPTKPRAEPNESASYDDYGPTIRHLRRRHGISNDACHHRS